MEFAKRLVARETRIDVLKTFSRALHLRRGLLALWSCIAIFVPAIARAESIDSTRSIIRFLEQFKLILDVLLPIVVTLAALAFFWGMVKFIWAGADEKAREAGKGLMVWGIIALFVMISVWGLIELFASLFGINQNATITVPSVPSGFGGGAGGGSI